MLAELNVSVADHRIHQRLATKVAPAKSDDLADVCRSILQHEIGFIFNQEFESLQYEDVEQAGSSPDDYIALDVDPSSLSGLPPYIAALYSIPLLTAAGESGLFRKMNYLKYWANVFRSGLDPESPSAEIIAEIRVLLDEAEQARDKIIESNLRLVVSIARKFCSGQTSFDDLVSEGNTILMKTVEKFDYARGFRFSTYVTHSVQRHFFRHFRQGQRRKLKEFAASEELVDSMATAPDDDALVDTSQADILLSRMSDYLDPREQLIITNRFGFGTNGTVRTFRSLGEELGLSKERVRQLLHVAVEKLRDLAIDMNMDLTPA